MVAFWSYNKVPRRLEDCSYVQEWFWVKNKPELVRRDSRSGDRICQSGLRIQPFFVDWQARACKEADGTFGGHYRESAQWILC